jgi:hypothetical protein
MGHSRRLSDGVGKSALIPTPDIRCVAANDAMGHEETLVSSV